MSKRHRFRFILKCTKSHLGFSSPLIHSIVSNDSGSRQWRPWSDYSNAQSDLGLCCLHMPWRHIFLVWLRSACMHESLLIDWFKSDCVWGCVHLQIDCVWGCVHLRIDCVWGHVHLQIDCVWGCVHLRIDCVWRHVHLRIDCVWGRVHLRIDCVWGHVHLRIDCVWGRVLLRIFRGLDSV